MKFSEQWLREWTNPQVNTQALADQLTMAGLEVAAVEPVAKVFSGVLIGHVKQCDRHPNADRLSVCQVDVGHTELLQIVCGGQNVAKDMKVAVAMIGAKLPDGSTLKKGNLRGVESVGMLCSAVELGLAETSNGILELPQEAPVGKDIRDYLILEDHSIDVELTPNRGDCLSILGLAREVSAINHTKLNRSPIKAVAPQHDETYKISVEASERCPRYIGRIIRNIDNTVATPLNIKEKLRRSSIRCINPAVDITNYVMLELGQPMHAFDCAKLQGGIIVRHAKASEKLLLLDGQEITLDDKTLVIADHQKALAIAGVMGGEESGVTAATKDIFLESAFFAPIPIAGTGRRYGLQTDSSYRFERGVDPMLQSDGTERATQLILEILGGSAGPCSEEKATEFLPENRQVRLRLQMVERILGFAIPEADCLAILNNLGMQVLQKNGDWSVEVPSYRFDIALEVDLIEEVGRIFGYNRIPAKRPHGEMLSHPISEKSFSVDRFRELLIDRGYDEVITYSFVEPKLLSLVEPELQALPLNNPISAELSMMRTSQWPGLLSVVRHNLNRQQERLKIFETGLCFRKEANGEIMQKPYLSAAICGEVLPEQWGSPATEVDFYTAKADVENLFQATGYAKDLEFTAAKHPALHPGQTAEIFFRGKSVGYLGLLHPSLVKELDLSKKVFLFSLDLTEIAIRKIPKFRGLSKFPSIRRDLAILVKDEIQVQNILTEISKLNNNLITDLNIFDVYRGEGIAPGSKSIALSLSLQHSERTLVEQEVNELMQEVIATLKNKFDALVRE